MKTKLCTDTGLPLKKGVVQLLTMAALTATRDAHILSTTPNEVLNVMARMDAMPYTAAAAGESEALLSVVNLSDWQPLVQEIFTTVEPIANEARRRGHAVGPSNGLQQGQDFFSRMERTKCLAEMANDPPFCAICAFPCSPFSPLNYLQPWKNRQTWPERIRKGTILANFAVDIAEAQLERGLHFFIENPAPSLAWKIVRRLRALGLKVYWVRYDGCAFGLVSEENVHQRKRSFAITSSPEVARALNERLCP